MLIKTSAVLCALCLGASGAASKKKQLPLDEPYPDRGPITMRCGTGSNTEECPVNHKCTAPPNCERYIDGVYYEGCIGICVPDY